MGTSVVLLSATLPVRTRRELLVAYAGREVAPEGEPYPAITWATASDAGRISLPAPEDRTVTLDWIGRDTEAVVVKLREALTDGGCAAVICNTVTRSQQVYLAVKGAQLVPDDCLTLFHARFPFGWRDEIEREVLSRFGKEGDRPTRAIVVATQVIEQSLDLDFDVIVSDLAPVDLLVQRAGRLHRHDGRVRPGPVAAPRLVLALDEPEGPGAGVPDFGIDDRIYQRYILLRTYLALRGRSQLALPGEGPELLELVYGDTLPAELPPALIAAEQRMRAQDDKDTAAAVQRLIDAPGAEGLLTETAAALTEDNPSVHTAFQALTRLSRPSVSLVCLHETPEGLNTEPDGSGVTINPAQVPDKATTAALVRATVSTSWWSVVDYFRKEAPPSGWRRHSLLRDHGLVVFRVGRCALSDDLELTLSPELGLEVVS